MIEIHQKKEGAHCAREGERKKINFSQVYTVHCGYCGLLDAASGVHMTFSTKKKESVGG